MAEAVHHVVNSLNPAGGGVPMVAVQVAAAQAAAGMRVHLHCLRGPQAPSAENDLAVILGDLDGIGAVTITRHGSRSELRAALTRAAVETCVLHLHGVWDLPLLTAAKVARRAGRAYVVTPHGMLDPWSLRQSRWKKRIAMFLAYRRMLSDAAFIQALNEDERSLMAPLRLRSRVEVVPNGVHLPTITEARAHELVRTIDPILIERPYFLFLARLHYKKGLDVLLDAYAKLPPASAVWPLVIAGPDEGMGKVIRQRVESGGFPGRVILPGPVYGETKSALLCKAGAVVLPSRQEGFSLTILEAMASGVPVVISDQCHFDEVRVMEAGLVVRVASDAVSKAMHRVSLAEPSQHKTWGRNGYELVCLRYTWSHVAARLETLYGSAASDG